MKHFFLILAGLGSWPWVWITNQRKRKRRSKRPYELINLFMLIMAKHCISEREFSFTKTKIHSQHSRTKNNNSSNVNNDLFSLISMTGTPSMLERMETYIYHVKQHVRSFNILWSWYSLISHWIEECTKENSNMNIFKQHVEILKEKWL